MFRSHRPCDSTWPRRSPPVPDTAVAGHHTLLLGCQPQLHAQSVEAVATANTVNEWLASDRLTFRVGVGQPLAGLLDDIKEGVNLIVPVAESHKDRRPVLPHCRRDVRAPGVEAHLRLAPVGGIVDAVELFHQVVCRADAREVGPPGCQLVPLLVGQVPSAGLEHELILLESQLHALGLDAASHLLAYAIHRQVGHSCDVELPCDHLGRREELMHQVL